MLNSCTFILPELSNGYTSHSEVMSEYSYKYQVRNSFGMPTYRKNYDGVEFWYYDMGSVSNSTGIVTPFGNGAIGSSEVSSYNRYVEFQFKGENVINWRTRGIDYKRGTPKSELYAWGALIDFFVVFFAVVIPIGIK